MLFALLALLLVVGPAWAIDVTLSDEEKAVCAEQRGCFMVTPEILEKALHKAFNEGKTLCGIFCHPMRKTGVFSAPCGVFSL